PCDQERAAAQIGGDRRRMAAGRRPGRAASGQTDDAPYHACGQVSETGPPIQHRLLQAAWRHTMSRHCRDAIHPAGRECSDRLVLRVARIVRRLAGWSCHPAPLTRTSFIAMVARPDQQRTPSKYSLRRDAAVPTPPLHPLIPVQSAPRAAGASKQLIAGPGAVFWAPASFAHAVATLSRAPEPVAVASIVH